jgi:hypothetical protein
MDKLYTIQEIQKLIKFLQTSLPPHLRLYENDEYLKVALADLPELENIEFGDEPKRDKIATEKNWKLNLTDLSLHYTSWWVNGLNGKHEEVYEGKFHPKFYDDAMYNQIKEFFWKDALKQRIAQIEEQKRMELVMKAQVSVEQDLTKINLQ